MLMSDAYEGEAGNEVAVECTAFLLNINYGHNAELMQKCQNLEGYSILIHKIRELIKSGKTKEEVIEIAIDECIKEGILVDILEKHRAEAKPLILEEYNEELHIRNEKEISYEEGIKQGAELFASVIERIRSGESSEDIMKSGVDVRIIDLASKYA